MESGCASVYDFGHNINGSDLGSLAGLSAQRVSVQMRFGVLDTEVEKTGDRESQRVNRECGAAGAR